MATFEEFNSKGYIGLIKFKGDTPTIAPERFSQMRAVAFSPWTLLKKDTIGYCLQNGVYWVICKESQGMYVRVPFAKNLRWWQALVSEVEYAHIGALPQIFITATA